jgi:beta-lactamase class A
MAKDTRSRITRRLFLASGSCTLAAGTAWGETTRDWQPRTYDDGLIPAFTFEGINLEAGGTLGVFALDCETGRASSWDANSLYPLNSTFKCLLAAVVLRAVDRGLDRLTRQIAITPADIVPWSPVVEQAVGGQMDLAALCAAMLGQSDNAAANLLLHSIGGPAAMTAALRDMGDPVTRIDRYEPDLNDVPPGDPRDSSTPLQMVTLLERLVLGDILSENAKAQLLAWMQASTTGDARIRAGVPAGWPVACRTGTGPRGETSTIAVIMPPARKPLIMAVYLKGSHQTAAAQAVFHAELARTATTNLLLPPYDPYAD